MWALSLRLFLTLLFVLTLLCGYYVGANIGYDLGYATKAAEEVIFGHRLNSHIKDKDNRV